MTFAIFLRFVPFYYFSKVFGELDEQVDDFFDDARLHHRTRCSLGSSQRPARPECEQIGKELLCSRMIGQHLLS